jgi:hypothetical protein
MGRAWRHLTTEQQHLARQGPGPELRQRINVTERIGQRIGGVGRAAKGAVVAGVKAGAGRHEGDARAPGDGAFSHGVASRAAGWIGPSQRVTIVSQQRAAAAATTRWTPSGTAHTSHRVRQAAEPGATSRGAAAPRWPAGIDRAPVGGSGGPGKGPWPLALQPRRQGTRAGVPSPDERAARGSAEGATRLKTRRRSRFHRAPLSGIRALRRGIESAGGVGQPSDPGPAAARELVGPRATVQGGSAPAARARSQGTGSRR